MKGKWRATGVPKATSEGKIGASQVHQGEKERKLCTTGARRKGVRNGALQEPKDSIEENTTVLLIALINEAWGTAEPLPFMKCFWKFIPGNTLKSKATSKNRHFLLLGLALVRDQNGKKSDKIHRFEKKLKKFLKNF